MGLTWRVYLPAAVLLVAAYSHWSDFLPQLKNVLDVGKLSSDVQSSDLEVQYRAARLSAHLSTVEGFKEQLRDGGFASAITRSIVDYPLAAEEHVHILSSLLLAASRVAEGELSVQREMVAAGILPRVVDIMKLGFPLWTAAAGQLLHSLSPHSSDDSDGDGTWKAEEEGSEVADAVRRLVGENAKILLAASLELLEKGAHSNSSDAVVSAAQIMHLMARCGGAPATLLIKTLPSQLPHQLLATHAGTGHAVMGAVLQLLVGLASANPQMRVHELQAAGCVKYVLSEMRASHSDSMQATLQLTLALAANQLAAEEIIAGGALSVCSQVLFRDDATPKWRQLCSAIISDLTHMVLTSPAVVASPGASDSKWSRFKPLAGAEGINTRQTLAALLQIARQAGNEPALQNAAVTALRNVGRHQLAAATIADLGGIPLLLSLLGSNATRTAEQHVWLLTAKRNTAMLVALLALDSLVRDILVEEGAIEAIAGCIQENLYKQGLPQQLRVTAAAALVPILGPGTYHLPRATMSVQLMESLVPMFYSKFEPEAKVARRVFELMKAHTETQAMFENVGINV